jgi:D-alanyl-D-alanine carboxypeptidase
VQLRRIGVAILALLLLAPTAARADRVDDYLRARIKEFHLPSVSLVVIKNGEIVRAQGYGLADVEGKVPAQADTVYKIGSVSKQFIATAIMLLVQDGRIALTDPVVKYIPAAPATWAPITIRHLLTHTSGIVRESPAFSPIRDEPEAHVFNAALSAPLRFVPGEKWEYSNIGYYALAEIIAVAAGTPWTNYLHERVFAPAGLATTFPTNTTRSVPNLAAGYTGNDNAKKANPWFPFRPSGAFLSTVLELAKWDAVLDSNRILSEASRREMWSQVSLNDGKTAPYGFGWHVHVEKGKRRVRHGGGLPGFAAEYLKYVDDRLTVIVLTNGDDVDLPSVASGVAALYRPN